ncbi:MAG: hypothetical protein HOA85_01790 [Candidatus Pacebacteria bacterium]|jgi:hypothetical protein|nr:hypothetical protein [Candidatus Paceibacterota bacterium]MBT6755984.1 hypothetical protein [Candidatus Paceibacterota bacterium]
MQRIFWFSFISCLFFIFSNTFVRAQVFSPSVTLFHSELDGIWEIAEPVHDYSVESIPWESSVDILLDFSWLGSVQYESLTDSFLFNTGGEFLPLNKLTAEFSTTENTTGVLQFSIRCRTNETETGFDQPFFVVFLDDELIEKEIDLEICSLADWGEWREKQFLFPDISIGEHSFYFFAGEMGDKQQLTQLEIREIKMSSKVSATVSPSPTTYLGPSLPPPHNSLTPVQKKSSPPNQSTYYDYNKIPEYHNWNTPPQAGSVLGESTSVAEDSEEKSFQFPEYFPLLIGITVFIFSFLIIFMFLKNKNSGK